MGLLDFFRDEHTEVHHRGNMTHDALAGAVAFEAARAYEKHCAENGQPADHALAKELLAGFAGAAMTRLVETKGLDAYDSYKQRQIQQRAEERLSERVIIERTDYD